MRNLSLILIFNLFFLLNSCAQEPAEQTSTNYKFEVVKTEKEWKAQLNDIEYKVLREEGTERAFSGIYVDWKKKGKFVCKACQNPLFSSTTKFKSGTGWPSFYDVLTEYSVLEQKDDKHGWNRVEIECQSCGSHLGHVFNDGPDPTGLRYCINSVCLEFIEE